MERINLKERFAFDEAKGDCQYCSFCNKKMKGRIGLTIRKSYNGGGMGANIWICLSCVDKVADFIRKSKEKHLDTLRMELL